MSDKQGSGLPPKIAEGFKTLIALCDGPQKDEVHRQMTFEDIAKELEINVPGSTLKYVFHEHCDIF